MQYPRLLTPVDSNAVPLVPAAFARLFSLLRWLVIGVGLAIGLYAANGVTQVAQAAIVSGCLALYNLLYNAARYLWVRTDRDLLITACADAIVVAITVGLSGGVTSPYFLFFYVIIAESSLRLSINAVLIYTTVVATDYTLGALFLSRRQWNERDLTILMAEVVLMFIVASVSTALARAIDEQRALAHREKKLSAQLNYQVAALSALNRLSEQLGARLTSEPDALLCFTCRAVPAALDAAACYILVFAPSPPLTGDMAEAALPMIEDPELGIHWLSKAWRGPDGAALPVLEATITERVLRLDALQTPVSALLATLRGGHALALAVDAPEWSPPAPLDDPNAEGDYATAPLPPVALPLVPVDRPAVLLVPIPTLDADSESPDSVPQIVLVVQRPAVRPFDASEQEIAAALGRQLALVIKNARLYEEERRNVTRLQELEQMKSDFLSAVSHELRTPLTSIKASVILMLDQIEQAVVRERARMTESVAHGRVGSPIISDVNPSLATLASEAHQAHEEAAEKLLRNIDRNTDRLGALVNDILDMTRLQHGRLKLTMQPMLMADVAREAAASLRPVFEARQQHFLLDIPTGNQPLYADRRRIEQVITNLLSNASRYSSRGGHIQLSVEEQSDEVRIAVTDDGPGIVPAEQSLIFEKFYRGVQTDGGRGGTGLGLAITRSLVELHGGRVWVESTGIAGEGSIFHVVLPRHHAIASGGTRNLDLSY